MKKVIRCKNLNNRKILALLIIQVFMGVSPVLLLISFVSFRLYEHKILAIIIIVLIFLCNAAYMITARRYNILNSGRRGEKMLYKTVKKLNTNGVVFVNLPIRYKGGRSEADAVIIGEKGIVIIEAKNHSGSISGSWKAEKWTQTKYYPKGKITTAEMENPIKQMRRQRDIVKSIFNASGENVWVDTVLYFSNESVRLKLDLRESDYVCLGSNELLNFLQNHKTNRKLSPEQMKKYEKILNEARLKI
ncbi:MAG: NERD domain-containing protein [Oscillospiraceae bacterium]|nr:NERD domain-containing protein [Oscillospiraceae bacterium]